MAASFSLARGTMIDTLGQAGAQTVTEGTNAPAVGDIEVRVSTTAGWTRKEVRQAMETIFRYFSNSARSTSIPL